MSIKALYVMGGNRAGEKLVASTSCGEMTPALSESGFARSHSATSLCVTTTQSNPPEKVEVQFYSHHAKELKYSQQQKIKKFLEYDCIKYDSIKKEYLCLPIPGYNTRTYTLKWNKELKEFECNCQGFQTKMKKYLLDPITAPKPSCSHIGALYEHFAVLHKQRRETNAYLGLQLTLAEVSYDQ